MFEVKNLCFNYGDKKILDEVSFKALSGEMVGLLGSNGAGKTTLFKNILLLEKSKKGEIYVDGINLTKLSFKERAQYISYVPQFTNFTFSITSFEFILTGIRAGSKNLNLNKMYIEVENIMKIFGIEHLAFTDMKKLSGGERQRVLVARAFAQQTRVIIMDEPTSNLDFKYKNITLKMLQRLSKERNITVIISLHDLNEALKFCDSFIALKDGKIFSRGNADEVFTNQIIKEIYEVPVDIIKYKTSKFVIFL